MPTANTRLSFSRSFRAVARHQLGGGAADRIPLDAEDAGHVAVHQHVAEFFVLDVDDRGHGVDHHLQQTAAFGDRVFGALLVGDIAHRSLIADDLAGFVAHGAGAVGEPEHRIVARANLVLVFTDHAVALHQPFVFRPRGAARRRYGRSPMPLIRPCGAVAIIRASAGLALSSAPPGVVT